MFSAMSRKREINSLVCVSINMYKKENQRRTIFGERGKIWSGGDWVVAGFLISHRVLVMFRLSYLWQV